MWLLFWVKGTLFKSVVDFIVDSEIPGSRDNWSFVLSSAESFSISTSLNTLTFLFYFFFIIWLELYNLSSRYQVLSSFFDSDLLFRILSRLILWVRLNLEEGLCCFFDILCRTSSVGVGFTLFGFLYWLYFFLSCLSFASSGFIWLDFAKSKV